MTSIISAPRFEGCTWRRLRLSRDKTERGYLDVAGGGNWNRESFSAFDDVPALTRNSAEVTVAQEAGYAIPSRLKFFERLAFFPNLHLHRRVSDGIRSA